MLFTDLLLVTKPVTKRGGDKLKIVKPPMRLDRVVVHALRDPGTPLSNNTLFSSHAQSLVRVVALV